MPLIPATQCRPSRETARNVRTKLGQSCGPNPAMLTHPHWCRWRGLQLRADLHRQLGTAINREVSRGKAVCRFVNKVGVGLPVGGRVAGRIAQYDRAWSELWHDELQNGHGQSGPTVNQQKIDRT